MKNIIVKKFMIVFFMFSLVTGTFFIKAAGKPQKTKSTFQNAKVILENKIIKDNISHNTSNKEVTKITFKYRDDINCHSPHIDENTLPKNMQDYKFYNMVDIDENFSMEYIIKAYTENINEYEREYVLRDSEAWWGIYENNLILLFDKDKKILGYAVFKDIKSGEVQVNFHEYTQSNKIVEDKLQLYRFRKDGKWGYINKEGKVIIDLKFDCTLGFSEGLAPVRIGDVKNDKLEDVKLGKWGYINKKGELVIPPQFDFTFGFHEDLAVIKINDKWGYINKKGEIIITPKFDCANDFNNGLAPVRIDDTWTHVDKKGNIKKENSIDSFLEKNCANVDLNKEDYLNDFSIFDEDILKNDVFLTGEGHAISKNFDIKLAMLKYFNKKADVKYLLAESGYSSSAYINKYLETGNEKILEDIYKDLKGTAEWSKESYEFWKKLREYNLTLPDDKKIKVVGIDIEHQALTALRYLDSIIPASSAPKKIKPTIEKFKASENNIKDDKEFIELINLLKKDVQTNEAEYKEYLADNFFDFSIVLDNIDNMIKAHAGNLDEFREPCIYSNFKRVYNHLPKGKYFGQWGMEHVYQRKCNSYLGEIDRFAMYLNSDYSPVKDKVLSIAYDYKDSFRMSWGKVYGTVRVGPTIQDKNINNIIDKYAKTDITIFKLTGENSPFNNELDFNENSMEGAITDYFQYFVSIKNSEAATPFDK